MFGSGGSVFGSGGSVFESVGSVFRSGVGVCLVVEGGSMFERDRVFGS